MANFNALNNFQSVEELDLAVQQRRHELLVGEIQNLGELDWYVRQYNLSNDDAVINNRWFELRVLQCNSLAELDMLVYNSGRTYAKNGKAYARWQQLMRMNAQSYNPTAHNPSAWSNANNDYGCYQPLDSSMWPTPAEVSGNVRPTVQAAAHQPVQQAATLQQQPAPALAPSVQQEPAPALAPAVQQEPVPALAPAVQQEPAPALAPAVQQEPAPLLAPAPQQGPAPQQATTPLQGPAPQQTATPLHALAPHESAVAPLHAPAQRQATALQHAPLPPATSQQESALLYAPEPQEASAPLQAPAQRQAAAPLTAPTPQHAPLPATALQQEPVLLYAPAPQEAAAPLQELAPQQSTAPLQASTLQEVVAPLQAPALQQSLPTQHSNSHQPQTSMELMGAWQQRAMQGQQLNTKHQPHGYNSNSYKAQWPTPAQSRSSRSGNSIAGFENQQQQTPHNPVANNSLCVNCECTKENNMPQEQQQPQPQKQPQQQLPLQQPQHQPLRRQPKLKLCKQPKQQHELQQKQQQQRTSTIIMDKQANRPQVGGGARGQTSTNKTIRSSQVSVLLLC